MSGHSEPVFRIGADGIDAEAVVEEIRAAVERKAARGAYADCRIARAERANLASLSQADFDTYFFECLGDAVIVDINDFEIQERRAWGRGLIVGFKRAVWKLLKFYTYRLWSQQNEVNSLLFSAFDVTDRKYREKIRDLEERIARLEAR